MYVQVGGCKRLDQCWKIYVGFGFTYTNKEELPPPTVSIPLSVSITIASVTFPPPRISLPIRIPIPIMGTPRPVPTSYSIRTRRAILPECTRARWWMATSSPTPACVGTTRTRAVPIT